MPRQKTRVILYGVGSIGSGIARVLESRQDFQIVGAIDSDPAKTGCTLAEIAGLDRGNRLKISDDSPSVLKTPAELVVHSTRSYFVQVEPEIQAIVRRHHNVISTCEELAEPWAQHPIAADALDKLARRIGVTVMGTGINPGFAMDTFPLTLSSVCEHIHSVRVRRIVDASRRRMQLQKKIGTGMSAAAFEQLAARREIRHVGLTESASLIAKGMGWSLDKIEETIEPSLATRRIITDYYTVDPTFVTGVRQSAIGSIAGEPRVTLELEIRIDAEESTDEVWIEGKPNLHSIVKGMHGDISTAAIVVNTAHRVVNAPPGLLTVLDLPIPAAAVDDCVA